MNLEYVFKELPEQHRMIIKSGMATNSIQILFNNARSECETQLFFIDDTLDADVFKLRYLELKKSIQAYDEILSLIHKLKQGDLK